MTTAPLSDNQHGFIPGRSCTTELLDALESWMKIINEGSSLGHANLDFSKAKAFK